MERVNWHERNMRTKVIKAEQAGKVLNERETIERH